MKNVNVLLDARYELDKNLEIEPALSPSVLFFLVMYFIALPNILVVLGPFGYSVLISWRRLPLHYSVRHRTFLSANG